MINQKKKMLVTVVSFKILSYISLLLYVVLVYNLVNNTLSGMGPTPKYVCTFASIYFLLILVKETSTILDLKKVITGTFNISVCAYVLSRIVLVLTLLVLVFTVYWVYVISTKDVVGGTSSILYLVLPLFYFCSNYVESVEFGKLEE